MSERTMSEQARDMAAELTSEPFKDIEDELEAFEAWCDVRSIPEEMRRGDHFFSGWQKYWRRHYI